ncbi:hypothetical protein pdul_cds_954 [Pandoravirus dulcis]|uniref:Uncharacterized protein n=1 Tax=Pandoravirus dulcis TaxID=1349409 RepID=A0A291AU79_9VIRU|nr:hypothetical protein pdul_cds_954 [Pandoravirus dulcis]ATE82573.1 hypothetical protein pdul_cds_954 [Pandoravirus dulcis]
MNNNNGAPLGTSVGNNYYGNNNNSGYSNGSAGAAYGAPAYGAPTTATAAYGTPPYGGGTTVLPRYGGPGAYYGTYAPAAPAATASSAAAPYGATYGGNGTLVGGPVVSPTTQPGANGGGGGPVVSPTTPPTGPVAPPRVPPAPTGPVAPSPPSNVPRRRQRPTWVSLINGMGAAVEVRWQSGGLSGTFRVPQSHAHVFMAPAPIDTLRVYALTSDGPPNDPIYDGPRQPAQGIPEPGPALNLLATGCGVFETMLDFYPGSVSGNGSTPAQNGSPNNGRPPVMPPPPVRPPNGRPPVMPPSPPPQNGGNSNNSNGAHTMPTPNGNANTAGRPVVGSFGTWRATDIAAAWARTCHDGHCGGSGAHPAEVDAVAPYIASVIPSYARGR